MLILFFNFFYLCVSVCMLACLYVYHVCVGAHGTRRGYQILWNWSAHTAYTSGYKQQCGSWKFNLGPLQEKPLLLTTKP